MRLPISSVSHHKNCYTTVNYVPTYRNVSIRISGQLQVGRTADATKEMGSGLDLPYNLAAAGQRAETCEDKKSKRWCDRKCSNERKCRKKKVYI